MKVLVTGSRTWSRRHVVDDFFDRLAREHNAYEVRDHDGHLIDFGWDSFDLTVIHGAARAGADQMAEDWTWSHQVPVIRYPAEWDKHGRSAGYRRNIRMIEEGKPDLVAAFVDVCRQHPEPAFTPHGSHGAMHTVVVAQAHSIPVVLYANGFRAEELTAVEVR